MITDSHSNNTILFEYYNCGVEIPTNFNLMDLVQKSPFTVKDWDREIRKFITEIPKGGIYNVIVSTYIITCKYCSNNILYTYILLCTRYIIKYVK